MRLRVNRIDCLAHGLCAELFPEWIRLDEWGYPILDDRELPFELVDHARRASIRCPALALWLEPENVDPGVGPSVALMP
jgi:ferredoxin